MLWSPLLKLLMGWLVIKKSQLQIIFNDPLNAEYWVHLVLSICDIIVSQKSSNGERKSHFFGWDNNFTRSLCAKKNFFVWALEMRILDVRGGEEFSLSELYSIVQKKA